MIKDLIIYFKIFISLDVRFNVVEGSEIVDIFVQILIKQYCLTGCAVLVFLYVSLYIFLLCFQLNLYYVI